MDKLIKKHGFTLVEILIASLLASVVFLAVASSYVSGLKFLTTTNNAKQLDPAIAMHAMSKNIALANQITIQSVESDPPVISGPQMTLRLDYKHVNGVPVIPLTPNYTADTSDDLYIMYGFVRSFKIIGSPLALRVKYGAAASTVTEDDPEVVPGFHADKVTFTLYNPQGGKSNAVTISIRTQVYNGGIWTLPSLETTVVAAAAPKDLT